MVKSATNLTNSGLRDWIVQRVSAVVLGLYTLFLFGYLLFQPHLDFQTWQHLFADPFMQIFTFLALLSLVVHAWIGVWTIFTDYVKPYGLRLLLESIMVLALISYLVWGIVIIW